MNQLTQQISVLLINQYGVSEPTILKINKHGVQFFGRDGVIKLFRFK